MPIIRQIAQLGRPVLRKVAENVAHPTSPEIHALVDDMLATMIDASGVGIAAPQVYQSLSLFIVAPRSNPRYPDAPSVEPEAMMNARLIWGSEEMEKGWEGCLSIPGLRGLVPRHRSIRVSYIGLDGVSRDAELEGFPARVFQHEYDHVQGILFIDRADSRELMTEKEYMYALTIMQEKAVQEKK